MRRQKRTLRQDYKDPLNSKHRRGLALYEQNKYRKAEEILRQVVRGRERTLGQEHEETLNSKYWLGLALCQQDKCSEAEEILRQVGRSREQTLGQDYEETLSSKHWIGVVLYQQNKYSEAEEVLQQAVRGLERILGQYDETTLYSTHWLGLATYKQDKYGEAEKVFQQTTNGRERTLGREHEETLYSKYWLGLAFCQQGKYSEAGEVLRQVVRCREQILRQDHEETLSSKYWLGLALYEQNKCSEAEEVLQQAVRGREKILGYEHADTLYSMHWLGQAIYKQKKYDEAEEILWRAVYGQEQTFGQEHEETLYSKHLLGLALYNQKKYSKAKEVLQQAVRGRERTLGPDHEDTLASMRLLQELHLNSSPPLPANITAQQVLASRISNFFPQGQGSRGPYTDSEIIEISELVKHLNQHWSNCPRTYIILRIIGHLDMLDRLIDIGFSDYWFPVTERNLPSCLLPSVKSSFVRTQSLVLTKSMDLEKGGNGQHCHFEKGEPVPFDPRGILGSGGFGQVDKVLSQISFKEYARKRVLRGTAFTGPRKEYIKQFVAEIQILKRLKHHHIVEFVGSYTDPKYIGLIMSPVADMDLGTYLKQATISNHPELRTFFGCLATALEFLHEQKIRHKDIKPGNILVNRGSILFTDFGLSFDFTDVDGSTTTSMPNGISYRYCAPEVAQYEPRNTMSDVWSLGVVFMEIIMVLKGRTAQDIDEFLRQHGSKGAYIRTNLDALLELIAEVGEIGNLSDNRALGWTQQMLSVEQKLRPTASSIVTSIIAAGQEGDKISFCGICCIPSEDDFSSSAEE
ncbi:hypothetical protein DPSP01_010275 [Paraphaeosphaeria sporulosa]